VLPDGAAQHGRLRQRTGHKVLTTERNGKGVGMVLAGDLAQDHVLPLWVRHYQCQILGLGQPVHGQGGLTGQMGRPFVGLGLFRQYFGQY